MTARAVLTSGYAHRTDIWLWLHFAAMTGEEGRRWAREFQAGPWLGALDKVQDAMKQLRHGEIVAGGDTLRNLEEEISRQIAVPSHARIFERYLYGAFAYERYQLGDHKGAVEALEFGEQAAIQAMGEYQFLWSLAMVFSDFTIQRARVARALRDWPALRSHLARARDMALSRRPLCVLADGREIFAMTVADFFADFEMPAEDSEEVRNFQDPSVLWARLESQTYQIPIPSHFIIPYQ